MIRNAIRSFNAGELTPQVDARSDVQKFAAGCRVLDNMIPRIYGSAAHGGVRVFGFDCVHDGIL
jgi:hypothetical protein